MSTKIDSFSRVLVYCFSILASVMKRKVDPTLKTWMMTDGVTYRKDRKTNPSHHVSQ